MRGELPSDPRSSRGPIRTCVGCRARRPVGELVRVRRRPDGRVGPGLRRSRSGRGAYVCASAACFAQAVRRRAFVQSLSRSGHKTTMDTPASLWSEIVAELDAELEILVRHGAQSTSGRPSALVALQQKLHASAGVPARRGEGA